MEFNKNILRDCAKDSESLLLLEKMFNDMISKSEYYSKFDKILAGANYYFWAVEYYNGEKQVFYSDSVINLTGYTRDEILSLPGRILSIIHEEDLQLVRTQMENLEESNSLKELILHFRIITKEQNIIWLKEDIRVTRDSYGFIEKIDAVVSDCTHTKEIEEKLTEKFNHLREINSAKDRFISIVSHDLRAPFTSLLGFSEILINEKSLSEDDRDEYLGYIYDASKSQLQLINYLLDWSRLQTGKITVDPKRLNAKNLLFSCVSALTGAAIRKNIELKIEASDELFINADERLINQVVSNLLSNAIKFTPEQKKIYVTAEKFKEGMIEIVVRDEGVGISESDQTKLFKIDEKVSHDGTNGEKGTGLGLTLVKEIVEKHAGNIWFYSEINKGSEFHITIPEARNIVLVVEDDPSIRILYRKVIKKALPNFDVEEASNGYEAMSFIMKKTPAAVITDHDMPLMSGIHLAEAMRKKDKEGYIPFIVISAKITDELRHRYNQLNIDTLIRKPFDSNYLVELLQKLA